MGRRTRRIVSLSLLLAAVGAGLLINSYGTRLIYGIQTDYQDIPPEPILWEQRTIRSIRADGPTINGLRWTARLFPEFTTLDDIYFCPQLETATSRHLIFRGHGAWGHARLVLTPEGQEPMHRWLPLFRWTADDVESRQSNQPISSAIADLRVHFGRLKPGAYSVQLVLPQDSYTIAGEVAFSPGDIASAKMEFRVVEPAVDRALAANTNPTGVEFIVTDEPYAVSWGDGLHSKDNQPQAGFDSSLHNRFVSMGGEDRTSENAVRLVASESWLGSC
jgi:hypothetical protein